MSGQQREGSLWSSSTLISAILFVGGNALWWFYTKPNFDRRQSRDAHDDSTDHACYFPGGAFRGYNRMSFNHLHKHGDVDGDDDDVMRNSSNNATNGERPNSILVQYSSGYYPKNSNWTHFESFSECSNLSSAGTECHGRATKDGNESKARIHHSDRNGAGGTSTMSMKVFRREISSDSEATTDGEDSQTSRDRFVWTDLEYRASSEFMIQHQQLEQPNQQGSALPKRIPGRPESSCNSVDSSFPGIMSTNPNSAQVCSTQVSVVKSEEFQVRSNGTNGGTGVTASSTCRLPKIIPKPLPLTTSSSDMNPATTLPFVDTRPPRRSSSEAPPPNNSNMLSRMIERALLGGSGPSRSECPRPVSPLQEQSANYNARIMPHKLILIRHGQSMGNIDEALYSTVPDSSIPLTSLGWEQARVAGQCLREIVNGSNDVHFVVSPYVRTVETFHGIASAWSDPEKEFGHLPDPLERRKAWYGKLVRQGLSWAEDPRIREQDFGNLQDPALIKKAKIERHSFGSFYYRFAHGESAADVFDRISTFLDSLWRSFAVHPSRYFVLVTHGISIRVLLARYFRYTVDQFNLLSNPKNCEIIVLTHDGHGQLQLSGRHELERMPNDNDGNNNNHGHAPTATNGGGPVLRYRFKTRLRILPPERVQKAKIRIWKNETYPGENKEKPS